MENERKARISPAARYPLYMIGLVVLILGELGAYYARAGVDAEAVIAVVGYLFLVLSVALR